MHRCAWAETSQIEKDYHDYEWGVPVHDDRLFFEFLILEGAQAGLSWLTLLNKRDGYRLAFADFDVAKVANFDENKIQQLLTNPAIVRNRLKVNSAVSNAQAFIQVQDIFGSFDQYIWQFVEGQARQNNWPDQVSVPAITAQSEAMSKDLKQRGFKFVGSTICYAFMQATGMVNDHTIDCFRYQQLLLD